MGQGVVEGVGVEVGAVCISFGVGCDEASGGGVVVSSAKIDEAAWVMSFDW